MHELGGTWLMYLEMWKVPAMMSEYISFWRCWIMGSTGGRDCCWELLVVLGDEFVRG